GAEHPTDHRRRLYPCGAVCVEGGGGLFPQPGDRTRSLDARVPAGNSAREGQSGRGGHAAQCHAPGDGRGRAEACGRLCRLSPELRAVSSVRQGAGRGGSHRHWVIEGACRHLVKDRMNLTGARWSLTGAEAVLRLRALRSSNDFDAYWEFHEQQEYERHHASHYADHRVPETVPSGAFSSRPSPRAKLKIVRKEEKS